MKRTLLTILFSASLLPAFSATYYVDFAAGNDTDSGTSTNAAWQHAPGDPNAAGFAFRAALLPGDSVNFKGGISYSGSLQPNWNGSAANPIIFQSAPGWGTGPAIFEGTVSAATNASPAFKILGKYNIVNGFEIRDYKTSPIFVSADSAVVSNNVIHHIGSFPYSTSMGWTDGGQAIYVYFCAGTVIVSNLIYDCNYNAVSGNSPTNAIIWGNEIHDVQNHGLQFWAYGYTVIANNFIHDETNAYTHSDAMQLLGNPVGASMIICGNTIGNCVDAINIQPYSNPVGTAPAGKFYVFNNVTYNAIPGTGGVGGWCNGSEMDTFSSVDSLYVWNNTFVDHNAGWGGLRPLTCRVNSIAYTNVLVFNNIFFNSTGGQNPTDTNNPILNLSTGYNCYTNYWRRGATLSGDGKAGANLVSLATYQADVPGQELGSVSGQVTFANYWYSNGMTFGHDFRVGSPSASVGTGTNLSNVLPPSTFSFLPAPWQVDPTVDATGKSRGSVWDMGAYQGAVTVASRPPPPSGLRVIGGP